MQSKFSFHVYQLQGGAGFGLTPHQNRAKMRGQKPTNHLFSTNLPKKTAHLCVVSPTGTTKAPPLPSPNWEKCDTNPRTAHNERFSERNKRVSSKNTAHRCGFVSLAAHNAACLAGESPAPGVDCFFPLGIFPAADRYLLSFASTCAIGSVRQILVPSLPPVTPVIRKGKVEQVRLSLPTRGHFDLRP